MSRSALLSSGEAPTIARFLSVLSGRFHQRVVICRCMFRATVLLTASLLCTSNAFAADTLSFHQALVRADAGLDVEAVRRALDLRKNANKRLSRMAYNPEIGVAPGIRERQETSSWAPEFQAYARQTLNLHGLGPARRDASALETQEVEARLSALRLSRKTDAADRWTRLWAAEREHALALEELPLAEAIVERITSAVKNGALTAVDLAEAEAYLSETKLRILDAEGTEFEASLALARVVGGDALPRTDGTLPAMPVDEDASKTLAARSGNGPTVAAARRAAEAERARAKESSAAQGFELHMGVAGGSEVDGNFAAATLGLTLPLFNRGERESGAQLAAATELDGQSERVALEARLDVLDALHEVEHTGERLSETRERLLPAQERAAEFRQRLASAGEATTVELLFSRRLVVATRALVARAEADHAFARVRLWLISQSLSQESP